MVGLTTGAITGIIGAIGVVINGWTDYGWVTKGQFEREAATHVTTADLEAFRVAHLRDDQHIIATVEARAADEEVKEDIKRILVSTLRDEILELQKVLCEQPNNQDAASDLAEALDAYEEAAGRQFPQSLLACR